jgi:hypothetical protein
MTKHSDLLVPDPLNIQTSFRCPGNIVCPERRADGKGSEDEEPVVIEQMPQNDSVANGRYCKIPVCFAMQLNISTCKRYPALILKSVGRRALTSKCGVEFYVYRFFRDQLGPYKGSSTT